MFCSYVLIVVSFVGSNGKKQKEYESQRRLYITPMGELPVGPIVMKLGLIEKVIGIIIREKVFREYDFTGCQNMHFLLNLAVIIVTFCATILLKSCGDISSCSCSSGLNLEMFRRRM